MLESNKMDDPEVARSHAYELAFSSEDELFHSTLDDWLISRGLADELLEVSVLFKIHSPPRLAEV
jgi:nuclear pore complex protein Nup155